ncbi:MAG TPA: PIG-L deacetylase family protein [Nitrospiria bacterium]|nr:PIG-L deacetylase family protein [Nitrospiria bacterium]
MTTRKSAALRPPPMDILAIGAHPDDIEIGCGGTLIKYAEHGHRVHLLVVTGGEQGGDRGVRRKEQDAAARVMGARRIFWGQYEDTKVTVDRQLIQKIERVIDEVDPLFIFVHYGDDTHQDHRHLATCTVTATRYTRNVLFYEGPTTQQFTPTVFVNIDSVLDKKLRALRAHDSQVMKTNIEGLSILDVARSSAHFRGIQGRVRNAEGFVPLRLFINID